MTREQAEAFLMRHWRELVPYRNQAAAFGCCHLLACWCAAKAMQEGLAVRIARFSIDPSKEAQPDLLDHWLIALDDGGFFDPTAAQVDGDPQPFRKVYPEAYGEADVFAASWLLSSNARALLCSNTPRYFESCDEWHASAERTAHRAAVAVSVRWFTPALALVLPFLFILAV